MVYTRHITNVAVFLELQVETANNKCFV